MANATISQIKVGNNTYDICDAAARDFTSIGEKIYPVGSIYLSLNDTNPAILFGFGTWEELTAGYALWTSTTSSAYGTTAAAGNTGSTTLTAAQSGLPAHTHSFTNPTVNSHSHYTAGASNRYVPYTTNGFKANSGADIDGTTDKYVIYKTYSDGVANANTTSAASPGTSGGAVGAVTGGAKAATSGHTHTAGAPARIYVHAWKRTA